MTEYTGESRFTRMEYGAAFPAASLLTKAHRDLVDLGITLPMHGRVYLSVDEIRELAEVAGVIAPVDPAWSREKLDVFTREVTSVTDDFVDRLRNLAAGVDGSGGLVSAQADGKPVRKPRRKSAGTGDTPDGNTEPNASNESGTDSAGSSTGPDGVPGDSKHERIRPDDLRI